MAEGSPKGTATIPGTETTGWVRTTSNGQRKPATQTAVPLPRASTGPGHIGGARPDQGRRDDRTEAGLEKSPGDTEQPANLTEATTEQQGRTSFLKKMRENLDPRKMMERKRERQDIQAQTLIEDALSGIEDYNKAGSGKELDLMTTMTRLDEIKARILKARLVKRGYILPAAVTQVLNLERSQPRLRTRAEGGAIHIKNYYRNFSKLSIIRMIRNCL